MTPAGRQRQRAYWETKLLERDQQHVTTRCAFCRKKFTGTFAEGRAWHRQHRRTHPQAALNPTPRQHTTKQLVPSADTLTNNLAHVRAQGGATWMDAA